RAGRRREHADVRPRAPAREVRLGGPQAVLLQPRHLRRVPGSGHLMLLREWLEGRRAVVLDGKLVFTDGTESKYRALLDGEGVVVVGEDGYLAEYPAGTEVAAAGDVGRTPGAPDRRHGTEKLFREQTASRR